MTILSASVDTQFLNHFQNMEQCKFLRQTLRPPKQGIVWIFILSWDYCKEMKMEKKYDNCPEQNIS